MYIPDPSTIVDMLSRAVELMEDHDLASPNYNGVLVANRENIDALGASIVLAMLGGDEGVVHGGFATLFTYGYICGLAAAQAKERNDDIS